VTGAIKVIISGVSVRNVAADLRVDRVITVTAGTTL
jgi:hypothetical protein